MKEKNFSIHAYYLPSKVVKQRVLAGLLAFPTSDAFPFFFYRKTVAFLSEAQSQGDRNHSCGAASDLSSKYLDSRNSHLVSAHHQMCQETRTDNIQRTLSIVLR